ncbi:MAG: sporulation protein [Clostridiales bacterium]|nr:sporulation protein [Clostridiales bacterium]
MNIMKIAGSIMVIASSTAIGFYFSGQMRQRITDLRELRKLIGLLRGDIRYAATPLPEAISMLARRDNGSFRKFLDYVSERLYELSGQTFALIWRSGVESMLSCTSLSRKDKLQLAQLADNLGYLDKDMQVNTLDLYIAQLDEEIADLSKTVREKAYLYNTLGIMAGIFITIVMI